MIVVVNVLQSPLQTENIWLRTSAYEFLLSTDTIWDHPRKCGLWSSCILTSRFFGVVASCIKRCLKQSHLSCPFKLFQGIDRYVQTYFFPHISNDNNAHLLFWFGFCCIGSSLSLSWSHLFRLAVRYLFITPCIRSVTVVVAVCCFHCALHPFII